MQGHRRSILHRPGAVFDTNHSERSGLDGIEAGAGLARQPGRLACFKLLAGAGVCASWSEEGGGFTSLGQYFRTISSVPRENRLPVPTREAAGSLNSVMEAASGLHNLRVQSRKRRLRR